MAREQRQRARHGVIRNANRGLARTQVHFRAKSEADAGMISVSGPGQNADARRSASGVSVPTLVAHLFAVPATRGIGRSLGRRLKRNSRPTATEDRGSTAKAVKRVGGKCHQAARRESRSPRATSSSA